MFNILPLVGKGQTSNFAVFEGNSFFYSANSWSIPPLIMAGLTGFASVNNAVNSATFDIRYANITTNYMLYPSRLAAALSYKNVNRYKNLLIISEGLNEVAYRREDGDPATVQNSINACLAYLDKGTKAGFSIVVPTITPASAPILDALFEQDRQAYNAFMRNLFPIPTSTARVFRSYLYPNVVLCDTGADPTFGKFGDSDNTTYYQTDKVHPTNLTSNMIATNYYIPAIKML